MVFRLGKGPPNKVLPRVFEAWPASQALHVHLPPFKRYSNRSFSRQFLRPLFEASRCFVQPVEFSTFTGTLENYCLKTPAYFSRAQEH